jgi:ribonuclease D
MTSMDSPKLDGILLEMLRWKRSELAHHVSQYDVCHDVSLEEMARYKPKTIEELIKIKGIKEIKANQYGHQFLETVAKRPNLTYERIYTERELMGLHNSAVQAYHRATNDVEKHIAIEKMRRCLDIKTKLLGECQLTRDSRHSIEKWSTEDSDHL